MLPSFLMALAVFFFFLALRKENRFNIYFGEKKKKERITVPRFVLFSKRMRKKFSVDIEQFLSYMITALRGGKDLISAMEAYKAKSVIAKEINIIVNLVKGGRSFSDAFEERNKYYKLDEMTYLGYVFQSIYEQGDVHAADILETILDQIRESRFGQEKLEAKTSGKKLEMLLVILLPIGMMILFGSAMEGFFQTLFSMPILIAIASFFTLIGAAWLFRMVDKIEV